MKKTYLAAALGTLIGGAIGVGVTYFVMKKREDAIIENVESEFRKYYGIDTAERYCHEDIVATAEAISNGIADGIEAGKAQPGRFFNDIPELNYKSDFMTEYHTYKKMVQASKAPGKEVLQEEETPMPDIDTEALTEPTQIPYSMYDKAEDQGSLCVTYSLFSCGTLTDDANEVVDKELMEELLGPDAFSKFGAIPGDDPDVLYIYNPRNDVYYEIFKEDKTYKEFMKTNPSYIPFDPNNEEPMDDRIY